MRFKFTRNWLGCLIIAVLAIGILFRFVNLDRKFYWIDETYTSLRVSGYTEAEMLKEISYQQIISPPDLQKYKQVNSQKTLTDTLNSLATEDPQHPPLYYVLARFWAQQFGSSVAAMRSLAAVISLLVFPAIYWLAWELFASTTVAWIAVAIFAISPYHILFAQEARQYSLWAVTTILSSAALLRAMRENQTPVVFVSSWTLYAVTLTAGLYTHLLFVCVAAAHAIYVGVIANWRDLKTFIAYYIAGLAALIAFIPTLVNSVENFNQIRSTTIWIEQSSLLRLVTRWVGSICISFFDFGIDGTANAAQLALLLPLTLAILALVGYAIYFLCRHTPKRVWLMLLLLIATTALFLAVPDLIRGGRRSANPRYLVPCYVGMQLAVACLLSAKVSGNLENFKQQRFGKIVIVSLFAVGTISAGISSQSETWWNKGSGWLRADLEVARTVNLASNPLIVSDANIAYMMPLSYRLEPKVKLLIQPQCYTSCYRTYRKRRELAVKKTNIPTIPGGFSDVFLYKPSEILRSGIEETQKYKIEPVAGNSGLDIWKLTKK